ncbi:cupin domain-containing protein [Bradyrhizobium sp. 147]|nr:MULTISPECIES: cupin domain-containing protein [unclassified Bradyrhizobium]MCK1624641.1 cupin domain-containing protein [Bradyrhizobium sp. 160]MCK1683833.1 cupin domain-containing protein [Bradyrhizobium sp. 147]
MTAAVLTVASVLTHTASAQQPGIKRTDLQRHDLSVPGREVNQVLVEFGPGISFPKHSHPGEEVVYVVDGSLEYALDGRPPVTLRAGEALFIPAGTPHAVKNVGSGTAAELATYIVEKGKPLLVLSPTSPK